MALTVTYYPKPNQRPVNKEIQLDPNDEAFIIDMDITVTLERLNTNGPVFALWMENYNDDDDDYELRIFAEESDIIKKGQEMVNSIKKKLKK